MESILVRCTKEVKDEVKNEADRAGITMNALIRVILREWLDKKKGA